MEADRTTVTTDFAVTEEQKRLFNRVRQYLTRSKRSFNPEKIQHGRCTSALSDRIV